MVAFLLIIIFIAIAVIFMHLFTKLTIVIQKTRDIKKNIGLVLYLVR